ncbi:PVC-type heme-binding CxxCH protein [Pirellulaceae bacterium SH449]
MKKLRSITGFSLLSSFSLMCVIALASTLSHGQQETAPLLTARVTADGNSVVVERAKGSTPIVTQVASPDHRPFLHPIVAPDGKGTLTQYAPDHHKHQTGIYYGYTKLNGRDYFHNPGASHWQRVSVSVIKPTAIQAAESVQWQTVYNLLDERGETILQESQLWTLRDLGDQYVMDLDWYGDAKVNVTIGKYDYGGLFVRMPWQSGIDAKITNSARETNQRAEGRRAAWTNLAMTVPGRDTPAHIAIFDHPQNNGYPLPWRVDGQFGLGTARSRMGDWSIPQGRREIIKHRFVIYTGEFSDVAVGKKWTEFSGQEVAYAHWQIAQQEGREAKFLTPEQSVEIMTVQPGFNVNVYAAEPMIAQPMAFCWDARGRMWVAENLDYETRGSGFANDGRSRISILEDTNGDGQADSRKTFVEGIPFPAGMAVGMGGLWLGAPPNLLFIPDKDNDDKADIDDIEVRLTGWGIRDRHETLNSFIWGPDGWLYGLQGFATPSKVGKPKGKGRVLFGKSEYPEQIEFDGEPVDINGGVWRYHPTKDRFEVVSHGFSNPWGIDYDAKGQLFITACVIPHLWHVIPGGIYHRQGGTHFNPYVYSDIKTITDHAHQSAHGGARVYQSDAFPDKYHGRIFMANIHEHAVLTDILEPAGSGYIGREGDDFLLANNAQWIGFSVEVGPMGDVYVLDWHDADICGKEVLNKDTGRIFRIAPEKSNAVSFPHRSADLEQLDDQALVQMQSVASVWHATRARIILQHRALSRPIASEAIALIRNQLASHTDIDMRLRGLWTLHAIQQLSTEQLVALLDDQAPHIRAWAIQLLCEDMEPGTAALEKFAAIAETDPSPVVRLYLASAMQRIPIENRWQVAAGLVQHKTDADDHNLPKMTWFAVEGLVASDPARGLVLASGSQIPLVTRHTARRLGDAGQFDSLVEGLVRADSPQREQLLLGMRDAMDGRYDLAPPKAWKSLEEKLSTFSPRERDLVNSISQQFGDTETAKRMLAVLKDPDSPLEDRRKAIQLLAGQKRDELRRELRRLMNQKELRRDAIRALASFDDVELARRVIEQYPNLEPEERSDAISSLASRSSYGRELTAALREGKIDKKDVPAHLARVLRRTVGNSFIDVWGPIDELSADKDVLFEKYRKLFQERNLSQADLSRGRVVFQKVCASCHKLYGEGGVVGPDITGANRPSLEYLLSNIITPSAVIQEEYKMQLILTQDGRVYSGIPAEENERQIKLRVADQTELIVIPISEIESRQTSSMSMMPDGLLATLSDQEALDLMRYLQSVEQVALPDGR